MNDIKQFQLPDYPLEGFDERSGAYFSSDLTSPPSGVELIMPDFSAHAPPTAPQAEDSVATAGDPPDAEFDMAILAAAEADPRVARELEFLRTQTLNNFIAAVNTISISLPREPGSASNQELESGPMDVRTLRVAFGGGAAAGRQHKELAEQLAIGALANLDNPAWDPADPVSGMAAEQSSLLAFLRG